MRLETGNKGKERGERTESEGRKCTDSVNDCCCNKFSLSLSFFFFFTVEVILLQLLILPILL